MRIFLLLTFFLTLSPGVRAAEGFAPSAEKSVVMLKGKTKGVTAFILQMPGGEPVLVAQQSALAEAGPEFTLQWGHAIGIFYRLRKVDERAYQFGYQPQVLWADDRLDVAVLKLPNGLLDFCKCRGLPAGEFRAGPAKLIGYPVLEKRIYPRTSSFLGIWRELWGDVQQRESSGRLFQEGQAYLGDMDALPGGAGPLLNEQGLVVGVVHDIKAARAEGYRYVNPALSFTPMAEVLKGLGRR